MAALEIRRFLTAFLYGAEGYLYFPLPDCLTRGKSRRRTDQTSFSARFCLPAKTQVSGITFKSINRVITAPRRPALKLKPTSAMIGKTDGQNVPPVFIINLFSSVRWGAGLIKIKGFEND